MVTRPGRVVRAKLSVNRGKLQAIFGFQSHADTVAVAMLSADLKIRPGSPNFHCSAFIYFELEMHA